MGYQAEDLIGRVFERLTVIGPLERRKVGSKTLIYWNCLCSCGNEKFVCGPRLRAGAVKSCGCLLKASKPCPNKIDLLGEKFNRLTVVELAGIDKHGSQRWICKCDCGNLTTNPLTCTRLKSGRTKSCGCLNAEQRAMGKSRTHGLSKGAIYHRWEKMLARCYNESQKGFNNYGGRGITVCDEWRLDFKSFYDWLVDKYPNWEELFKLNYQLDRIDNDGNYEPNNVRLTEYKRNNRNKRTNVKITIDGKEIPAIDYYESRIHDASVEYNIFVGRVKDGWDIESSLRLPLGTRYK